MWFWYHYYEPLKRSCFPLDHVSTSSTIEKMKSIKVSDSSYEYIRSVAFHQRKTHQEIVDYLVAFKESMKERDTRMGEKKNRVLDQYNPPSLPTSNNRLSQELQPPTPEQKLQSQVQQASKPLPDKKGNMEFEI